MSRTANSRLAASNSHVQEAQKRAKPNHFIWVVFGALVLLGLYLLAVTPVTTYLDQRAQTHTAERRAEMLESANQQLQTRVAQLNTDSEIERIARDQYGLVPAGKQAYTVLPSPSTSTSATVTPSNGSAPASSPQQQSQPQSGK